MKNMLGLLLTVPSPPRTGKHAPACRGLGTLAATHGRGQCAPKCTPRPHTLQDGDKAGLWRGGGMRQQTALTLWALLCWGVGGTATLQGPEHESESLTETELTEPAESERLEDTDSARHGAGRARRGCRR